MQPPFLFHASEPGRGAYRFSPSRGMIEVVRLPGGVDAAALRAAHCALDETGRPVWRPRPEHRPFFLRDHLDQQAWHQAGLIMPGRDLAAQAAADDLDRRAPALLATARLRWIVEQPRDVVVWGARRRVVDVLFETGFGDQRSLAWIEPVETRPSRYIVQVDSRWDGVSHRHIGGPGCDAVDLLAAIKACYGPALGHDDQGRLVERPWPAVDDIAGVRWGTLPWPAGLSPPHAGDDRNAPRSRGGDQPRLNQPALPAPRRAQAPSGWTC